MPILARAPESKYPVAPEGLHPAVCCDVVDLGLCDTQFGQKHKVELRWQLEEAIESETKGLIRPIVRQRFTNSLHEKAKLRGVLETWRGRKFTKDELTGFDLEKLLGVSCQIQVIHNISDEGQTFANVNAVIPLGKGMAKVRAESDYVRQQDRERQQHNQDVAAAADEDPVPF
jgi:hypothetical protein